MESVNQSRRRVLDIAPFYLTFLLCGLALNHPSQAISLFDPERGAQEQDNPNNPSTNGGDSLQELRLQGILTIGSVRRVVISGPEGETYRFNWRGEIVKPMVFEGGSADRLAGYLLSSASDRSVWLQLPPGAGCQPDPKKGITACEKGHAKLTMVHRDIPLPASTTAESENAVNSGQQGLSSALARRLQQRRSAPAAAQNVSVNSIQRGTTPASTRHIPKNLNTPAKRQTTSLNSGLNIQTQAPNQTAKSNTSTYVEDPARARMREEQQRLIDSAPPNWWGVK